MLKYSNLCAEDYGVKAFITSQALTIDYFILISPIDDLDNDTYKTMSKTFAYRFGFPIDAVGIVDKIINTSDSNEEEKIVYEKADLQDVNAFVDRLNSSKKHRIQYFNVFDSSAYDTLVGLSIDALSNDRREDDD